MFKKLFVLLVLCFLITIPVYAVYIPVAPGLESINTGTSGENIQIATGLGANDPIDTTSLVINWLLTILGLFFLVLTLYGGFIWMMARGNESEVEKATNIIKAAIVGLVIVLASYGISAFIFNVVVNISQS